MAIIRPDEKNIRTPRAQTLHAKGKRNITISLFIVGLIFIAFIMAQLLKPKYDEFGCTNNIPAKNIVLIDVSDNVAKQTIAAIKDNIQKINKNIAEGELVSIFALKNESKTDLKPLFSYCKPADGGNQLYQNDKSIKAKYREKYEKPFEMALENALGQLTGSISTSSPLAGAITDLSLSKYLKDAPRLKLFMFSDMMENDKNFSLYSCNNPNEDIINKYKESRLSGEIRPAFHNLDIRLYIMPRINVGSKLADTQVEKCRNYFWNWYFGDNNGGSLDFEYLPG